MPPAFFHSDVRVFNTSPTTAEPVTARYRCFTGSCPVEAEKTFEVAPREMKVLDDVIATLFAASETAGAIELDGNVHVESRVYTPERAVHDVFTAAGVTVDVPAAHAIVTGDHERRFFAYATVIDNQSQDSVFVKGRASPSP